jgi:hypothetical protein
MVVVVGVVGVNIFSHEKPIASKNITKIPF